MKTSFRMPTAWAERIAAVAKKYNIPMSAAMRQMIVRGLQAMERELEHVGTPAAPSQPARTRRRVLSRGVEP